MKTRKDLQEEYKQLKFPMGVFQIRNTVNNKVFIGTSTNLEANWRSLKFQLEMGSFPTNRNLLNDWKEYGPENFVYEILQELEQPEDPNVDIKKELKALETLCIDVMPNYDQLAYNAKPKTH